MSKRLSKRQLREQQELQTLGGSGSAEGTGDGVDAKVTVETPIEEEVLDAAAEDEEAAAVSRNNAGAGLFTQVRRAW
jgi:hypothetical protein